MKMDFKDPDKWISALIGLVSAVGVKVIDFRKRSAATEQLEKNTEQLERFGNLAQDNKIVIEMLKEEISLLRGHLETDSIKEELEKWKSEALDYREKYFAKVEELAKIKHRKHTT